MIKCVVRRQAPWGCGLWGGGGNNKEWLNTNNTIGIIRALRSGTHESIRERAHLCLLPCPTGDEAGDDARFIIDDEAYDFLTNIQRAMIEQCDIVSSDTSEKEMTFGLLVFTPSPDSCCLANEGPGVRPRIHLLRPAEPGVFRLRCGVSSGTGSREHLKVLIQ